MPTDNNENDFVCSVCANKFKNEQQYFGHLQTHSGEVAWKCTQCDNPNVTFESQSKLKTHENLHHNLVKPFKCAECDLVFDRASQLDYHTRSVHLNEKSQLCQICGKGFFRKADLKTHLNVHLGTNQSICEICGRKFNHVSNLIRHCRTHAGLKPYPCSICGKRFTQISSLARHKNIHERSLENMANVITDEVGKKKDCDKRRIIKRRHYCKTCGESFQFIVLLRQHETIHMKKPKLNECKACNRILPSQVALQRHSCSVIPMSQRCDIILKSERNEKKKLANSDEKNINEENIENPPKTIIHVNSEHLSINNEIQSHELLNPPVRELTRKMNAIGIDNDRDESINISDILSPYNCDEIEFTNSDSIHRENCSGTLRKLIQTEVTSTKESPNKNSQVETNQLFIEVCESEYLKSLGLQTLELQENGNVAFVHENLNITGIDRTDAFENTINDFNTESSKKFHGLDHNASTLRLVQTDSGEQFYELEINHLTETNLQQSGQNVTSADDSLDLCLVNENDNEQWHLQSSHMRNDLIDFNSPSTREEENCESSANLKFSLSKNSHLSLMGDFPNHVVEQNCESFDNHREMAGTNSEIIQTPMVRLVQNEEGEQFFELIRDSGDFDDSKEVESAQDTDFPNKSNNEPHIHGEEPSTNKNTKQQVARGKSQRVKQWKQKFKCNVCNKQFSSASNLKQHVGIHFLDQQKFQCKECGISFAWKSTLNKHIASNHRPDGPQKFVCEICPKVYSTLSQVNEHVKRDHLKERNHVCSECGKCFFKKFDLKSHIRTHTNERPYICQACGKGFHHHSHIIRHERIHSGERPYSCDYCQKTFTQPGSLKAHKQRHREVAKVDILDYRIDEDDPVSLNVS